MSSRLLQTQQLVVSGGNPTPTYVLTCADQSGLAEWAPAASSGADIIAGAGIEVTGVNPKTVSNITMLADATQSPPLNSVSLIQTAAPPTYELKVLQEGANITLDDNGSYVTINASATSSLAVENEGVQVTASASVLNFTGAGVDATASPSTDVTITVPGVTQGSGISVSQLSPTDPQVVAANIQFNSAGGGISLIESSTGSSLTTKSLVQGNGISITNSPVGEITIASSGTGLTSQNEGVTLTTNTASLDFTGVGVIATAVGDNVTVNVPGVQQGAGIIVTQSPIDGPQIIDANVSLTSAGGDISLVSSTSTNSAHVLKGLSAGSGITLENSPEGDITIHGTLLTIDNESTPLTTQAASLNFTGAGVVASAVGDDVTIQVPGVVAGDGSIIVTQSPADLAQSLVANVTLSTASGGGISLVSATSTTSAHVTKNLVEGPGITLQNSPDGEITISASASGIPVSEEGSEITPAVTSFDFTGNGVTASAVGNDVTVNVPGYSAGFGISLGPTDPYTINAVNVGAISTYSPGNTIAVTDLKPGSTIEFANVPSNVAVLSSAGGLLVPASTLSAVTLPTAAAILSDPSFDYVTVGSTWTFYTRNLATVTTYSDRFTDITASPPTFVSGQYSLATSSGWTSAADQSLLIAELATDEWQIHVTSLSPPAVTLVRVSAQPVDLPAAVGDGSPVGTFTLELNATKATTNSMIIFEPSTGTKLNTSPFSYGGTPAEMELDLTGYQATNLMVLFVCSGKLTTMMPMYWQ